MQAISLKKRININLSVTYLQPQPRPSSALISIFQLSGREHLGKSRVSGWDRGGPGPLRTGLGPWGGGGLGSPNPAERPGSCGVPMSIAKTSNPPHPCHLHLPIISQFERILVPYELKMALHASEGCWSFQDLCALPACCYRRSAGPSEPSCGAEVWKVCIRYGERYEALP